MLQRVEKQSKGPAVGRQWGETHTGHPHSWDKGRRRQSRGEVEGKRGRGPQSQCEMGHREGEGPLSSYGLPRLECEILVEGAGKILLGF